MSYNNPRIKLEMSFLDVMVAMTDGNPGAAQVCMLLSTKNEEIDPDNALGKLGPFLSLDTLDCYGPDIWVFFKDICGSDPVKMLGVMRAIDFGYTSGVIVMSAIKAARTGQPRNLDIDDLLKKVRERLPRFGQQRAA